MGCLSSKRNEEPALLPQEKKPNAYKTATETLIDVKDYTFVEFDSRLPLTKRQIFSLVSSWRAVRRDIVSVGTEMIVELLHSDPAVRKVFTEFQDLDTKDKMRASLKFEKHALKVMNILDDVIIYLDEYEHVSNLLNKTAVTHSQWIGKQPELFLMIKQPFLKSIENSLGERYTENIRNIYEILIDWVIVELIKDISSSEQEKTLTTE